MTINPALVLRYRFVYVYVLLIPLVNWSFAHVPTVPSARWRCVVTDGHRHRLYTYFP